MIPKLLKSRIVLFFLFAAIFSITFMSCGRIRASGSPTAIEIMGPPGFSCFAVMNGDQAVGGNCIKE